jgi:flagellar motor component MotA
VAAGQLAAARARFDVEKRWSVRGLSRIDSVSQIATSLGLFGTVFGIARAFTARGGSLGSSASEVLASGLTTALFTTVAGLIVFLLGQGFLIVWGEWLEARERAAREHLERGAGRP